MQIEQDQAEHQFRLAMQKQFSERLNLALDLSGAMPRQGRGRIEAASIFLGTSISTTQRMLTGTALPEAHRLSRIADKLGVTIDYLLGNANEEESGRVIKQRRGELVVPQASYFCIPILNPDLDVQEDRYLYASRAYVSRFINPVESAGLMIMRGESMAPTVLHSEMMLLATMEHRGEQVLPEGLYPLRCRDRDDWTLRRIQPVTGGQYAILCDNPHYPPVHVPHHALTVDGDYEWMVAGRLRTLFKRY